MLKQLLLRPRDVHTLDVECQTNQTPLASSSSETSLELIGYRVDALLITSRPLQVTLFWRAVRPAAEDWTAFFHFTPHGKNAELLGKWTS